MHRISIPFLFLFAVWLALAPSAMFASEEGSPGQEDASPSQSGRPLFTLPEPPPEHDFGDNDPNVILAMGDSITAGIPFVAPGETYPALLQAMLGRTVVNAGLGGARSRYGVDTVDRLLRRYKPGYVLIMFGANDVLERSAVEITNNLLIIASKAKENKSIPILATVTPTYGPRIARKPWILGLNETLLTRAAEHDYLVADVATDFGWDGQYLLPDGLHPNSAGMEIIAQSFYEKILEAENEVEAGGGGGGCTVTGTDRFSADWVLVFSALLILCLHGRRYRQSAADRGQSN